MANDDKALGADEVEARLSELLSDMSEGEKRDFLEKLTVAGEKTKGKSEAPLETNFHLCRLFRL